MIKPDLWFDSGRMPSEILILKTRSRVMVSDLYRIKRIKVYRENRSPENRKRSLSFMEFNFIFYVKTRTGMQ